MLAHTEDVLNSHKHALLLHLESRSLWTNKNAVNHVPGGAVGIDLDENASEPGAHTWFNVRSEYIQTGPSRGTEEISEASGTDSNCRIGVSPRSAVYAPPPDMAEDTGAKKGVENGPCPCCGHSQVLERAEIMAEPRPVPTRRPDGYGHAAESGHGVATVGWLAHCNGVPASVYWTVGETVAH